MTTRSLWSFITVLSLAIGMSHVARAVSPTPDEMVEARRCATAIFSGAALSNALQPGLEVVSNYDLVQKNARFGKPLKLAGQSIVHGLFCHANSRIIVRLPGPGKTFDAVVGVDSNEQTGRGSRKCRVRRTCGRKGGLPIRRAKGGNAAAAGEGRLGRRQGVCA